MAVIWVTEQFSKDSLFVFWLCRPKKLLKLYWDFVDTLYSQDFRDVASNGLQANFLLRHKFPHSSYQCPFQNDVIIRNLSILAQNNRSFIYTLTSRFILNTLINHVKYTHACLLVNTQYALHVQTVSSPPSDHCTNVYCKTQITNV